MRVTIRGGHRLDAALRELTTTRLAAALGRFTARVQSLRVHFVDVNGPKGGEDQRCVVEIRLRVPARTAVIEELDASAEAAISRAAERSRRVVARMIDNERDRRLPRLAFQR